MKCPKCNCEDIAITVQYHKSTICRIIKFFLLLAIFATIILNMAEVIQFNEFDKVSQTASMSAQIKPIQYNPDNTPDGYVGLNPTGPTLLAFTTALIFCEIIKQWLESKKCIYCVCKQCNKIWIANDILE